MRRVSIFSPMIINALTLSAQAWSPPVEYHWHSHPSAPGSKPTRAAAIKRHAKKRRNSK